MGLRPGGERPEIELLIAALYAALYDSVAAHSRQGLNVVVDVGHHDAYSAPLKVLSDAARRLRGLPALLVGIRCPLEVIMARRDAGQAGREGHYVTSGPGGDIPEPVLRWQRHVHLRTHARQAGLSISAVVAQALEEFLARGHRNRPRR